jgi:hypothetical protein
MNSRNGDRQATDNDRFYATMVPKADNIYTAYITELEEETNGQ